MKLEPFLMEREQSTYEHRVAVNLSESGVDPLTVGGLLDLAGASPETVLDQRLIYTQTNGSDELRAAVAEIYGVTAGDAAGGSEVLMTTGCAEANLLVTWHLVEPGDEVVMLTPNYMQTWGLVRSFGANVREWRMRPENGRWTVDLDELATLVNDKTRLILLCNPNNPTGACLDADILDGIAGIAARHGAWILSDEVYRGAENAAEDAPETPTMWGRGERIAVTCGLSKAYGLPGLRIGWVTAPADTIEALWSRHDYTTICPSAVSDRLARLALDPVVRPQIRARCRRIIRENLAIVTGWLDSFGDFFDYVPPEAAAITYTRYHHRMGSTELATRLREEKDVLVVPGDHFLMDGYLRLGFGEDLAVLEDGLGRIRDLLNDL